MQERIAEQSVHILVFPFKEENSQRCLRSRRTTPVIEVLRISSQARICCESWSLISILRGLLEQIVEVASVTPRFVEAMCLDMSMQL